MTQKKQDMYLCPVCLSEKTVDETPLMEQQEELKNLVGQKRFDLFFDTFSPQKLNGYTFWSCNDCLNKGKALRAHLEKQNFSLKGPFLAYVDVKQQCTSCQEEFIFLAAEQCYWYENLFFNTWSHPKQCLPCRKQRQEKRKINNELMELLSSKEKNSKHNLEKIAELYKKIGSKEKARIFLARAHRVSGSV